MLNQGCLHFRVVFLAEVLAPHVLQYGDDRQSFHALAAPVCAQFGRVHTPYFGRIILKEHLIQRTSEAVDIEVLQRSLRQFVYARPQVSEARAHHPYEAHVEKSLFLHRDGIVEELAQEEDSAHAAAEQHCPVFFLRIRTDLCELFLGLVEQDVVLRRLRLQRHHLFPPCHHLIALGEETVSAYIHAVAVVFHRLGDTAYRICFLAHDRFDVRLFEQLIRRCQTGRACSCNNCYSHIIHFLSSILSASGPKNRSDTENRYRFVWVSDPYISHRSPGSIPHHRSALC